jgi:hypothetical protein
MARTGGFFVVSTSFLLGHTLRPPFFSYFLLFAPFMSVQAAFVNPAAESHGPLDLSKAFDKNGVDSGEEEDA